MKKLLCALLLLPALAFGQINQQSKSVSLINFGADPTGVADVYAAFTAAINSGATRIEVPPGKYLLAGAGTVALNNIEIECHGAPAQYNTPPAYGSTGATFLLTSTSVQPFTLQGGVRIKGCNFFWPNQTGTGPTPTAYPALFTEVSGKAVQSIELISDRIINAYDVIDQANSADAFGAIGITNVAGYAIRYWLQLANVTEWVMVSGFYADFGIYQNVAGVGPNYYLATWTAANGAFLHVFGNGNGTVASTVGVAGFNFSSGGVYAYDKFIWVDSTGAMSESKFHAIYDSIPTVVQVDSGGCIADVEIDGPIYSYLTTFPSRAPGGPDNAPAFTFGTPGTGCVTGGIRITGHLFVAQGDVIDITGAGNKGFYVNISGSGHFGNSSTAGTYYFAQVNSSTAIVDFIGNHVEPSNSGSTRSGFNITNCYTCTINGNSFNGIYNAVIIGGSTIPVAGTGNISLNSASGGASVTGSGDYAHLMLRGNAWDKYANPTVSACGSGPSGVISDGRSTDDSGVVTVGGGTVTSCTITFVSSWAAPSPRCYVSGPGLSAYPLAPTTTPTALTVTSSGNMGGAVLVYHCEGVW